MMNADLLSVRPALKMSVLAVVAVLVVATALIFGTGPSVVSAQSSDDATLSSLEVSPRDIIGFAADRAGYEVGVASTVTRATVTATANNSAATVAYSNTNWNAYPTGTTHTVTGLTPGTT